MKNLFIFFALLISVTVVSADEVKFRPGQNDPQLPATLKEKPAEFFKLVMSGEVSQAYDKLLQKSLIARNMNDVDNLVTQTYKSMELYGEMKGFEPVSYEIVSPSYIKLKYITLHDLLPMRWIFIYYNSPQSGWVITNIKFDDLTENLFTDER